MPYYDYECKSCGHEFETFQSMSDEALVDCPECNKPGLRRLIGGGTGVIFKGSGFYVNDSRKSGSETKSKEPAAT
jgi:putative FmdB family regulatory protein